MDAHRDVIVGQVRRSSWERVAHGLYRRGGLPDGDRADLVALQAIMPPSGCLTHLTAAALHGLWLPPVPPGLPVIISMDADETRPKRPEVGVMRHTRPVATTRVDGLTLATVEECLLACARDLSLLDLVVLGDSALAAGLTTRELLAASGSRRRWGGASLRRAVSWMDPRSESPWESLLRVLHRSCGIKVAPQHVVKDGDGAFVARGDLWLVGTRMLHEYDGAGHRDRHTHVLDLDRDRRLLAARWQRRGYVARDLLRRPHVVLAEADETLGRRHRPDRLDAWLSMVGESLYADPGRERLAARWTPTG